MFRVPSVVSSVRAIPLASLALAAGVAMTSPALAQPRLSMELDRPVITSGETVAVEVFGHFPGDAFALAQAEFDLFAPLPQWRSASSGVLAGDSVWGASFEQLHQPWAGMIADSANPLSIWQGAYRPEIAGGGPAFLRLDAKASYYAWYPSDLTSSTAVGDADPARAYLWVDPVHIPGVGEVAPGEGTTMETLPGGQIIAEPKEEQILIGLLLPAVQKVREASVRMSFTTLPDKASAKLMLQPATPTGSSTHPTEEMTLNYTKIDRPGAKPMYELAPAATFSGYTLICVLGPKGEWICYPGSLTAAGEPLAMFDRIPECLNFKIEEDPITGGDMVVATTCDEDPIYVHIPGVFEGLVEGPIQVRVGVDYFLKLEGIAGESLEATGLPRGPEGRVTIEFEHDGPCIADFDGDGELTFFDFLAFQAAFSKGLRSADIDGDGELTFFDFLAFQKAYAAGC